MNSALPAAQALSPWVHRIGTLDPAMRSFDIILKTPKGTTYNAYPVLGSGGAAIIDTVKAECAAQFFADRSCVSSCSTLWPICSSNGDWFEIACIF
jgi:flavorubredoxin